MEINYWDCKFNDFDQYFDGEEETNYYNCNHIKGCGTCNVDNKWNDDKAECILAKME